MTNRDLNITITTTDKASRPISDIADDVEAVEGDHDVDLEADTSQAKPQIEGVRTDLEKLTGREWIAKLKSDIEVDKQSLTDLQAELDALADADGKIDPKNLREVDSVLGKLPGAAGDAGSAIGDAFTGAGTVVGAAAGGVGVALAAWKIHTDRAKQHAQDAVAAMQELTTVSDDALGQSFARAFVEGTLSGKSLEEIMATLADTSIEGARRLYDMAEAVGLSKDQQEALKDAIYEEERQAAQAADTQKRYGENMFYAAEGARALADGIDDINSALSRAPRGQASGPDDVARGGAPFAVTGAAGPAAGPSVVNNTYVTVPQGTPALTADQLERYQYLNGNR